MWRDLCALRQFLIARRDRSSRCVMRDVVAVRRRLKPPNRFAVLSKYNAVAETTGARSSVFSRSSDANRLSSSESNAGEVKLRRKLNVRQNLHDSKRKASV